MAKTIGRTRNESPNIDIKAALYNAVSQKNHLAYMKLKNLVVHYIAIRLSRYPRRRRRIYSPFKKHSSLTYFGNHHRQGPPSRCIGRMVRDNYDLLFEYIDQNLASFSEAPFESFVLDFYEDMKLIKENDPHMLLSALPSNELSGLHDQLDIIIVGLTDLENSYSRTQSKLERGLSLDGGD